MKGGVYRMLTNHLKTADGTGTDTNADTGKKKVPYPGTDRQIPSTGKGRTRTHLHTAGPDTGDKQSSRPEQAAGGVLQQIERIRLFTL